MTKKTTNVKAVKGTETQTQPSLTVQKSTTTDVGNTAAKPIVVTQRQIEYENPYQQIIFYLARARDLARDRDIAHALDLARALDLALDLAHARDIARDRALTRALARTLDLARDFALARTRAHTRTLDLDLDLNRARALALDRVHALDRALANDYGSSNFRTSLHIGRLITQSIILLLEILASPTTEHLQLTLPTIEHLQLTLNDSQSPAGGFSSDYLATTVMPYISALIQIHQVIEEIHGRFPTDIKILGIRYGSVSVDLTGGIRDTVELILNILIPWRQENQKKLAELAVKEKELQVRQQQIKLEQEKATLPREAKQAEVTAERTTAETRKVEAEAQKVEAEARLLNEQAQKQQLDNQKMQLEIMKLTLEMITKIAPDLPEEKRLLYAMKMVDPVRLIVTSPLEIVAAKMMADEKAGPAADSGDEPERESTTK